MSLSSIGNHFSGFASRSWETAKDYSRTFLRALPTISTIVAVPLILAALPIAAAEGSEQMNASLVLADPEESGALSMVQDVAMTAAAGLQTVFMIGGVFGAAAYVDRENRIGNLTRSVPDLRESNQSLKLCTPISPGRSDEQDSEPIEKKYLVVDKPGNKSGMFATFLYMLGVYDEFEKSSENYSGLEINFGTEGVYYDANRGPTGGNTFLILSKWVRMKAISEGTVNSSVGI